MKKLIIALTILSLMVSQSYSCDGRLFDKYEKYIENFRIDVDCKTCGKFVKEKQDAFGDKLHQYDDEKAFRKTIGWLNSMPHFVPQSSDYKDIIIWYDLLAEYMKVEKICAPDTKRLKARAAVFTSRAQDIIIYFRTRCYTFCNCEHCKVW